MCSIYEVVLTVRCEYSDSCEMSGAVVLRNEGFVTAGVLGQGQCFLLLFVESGRCGYE